jgi:acetyl-CoA C-acetyltransferase
VPADICAAENKISREEQDQFAIESYQRSQAAWNEGRFADEIVPVTISSKKGDVVVDRTKSHGM